MSWEIDEETREAGCGPLVLDVAMARDHGWSEEDIKEAFGRIEFIARYFGAVAKQAHPERYEEDEDGNIYYAGKAGK